MVGVSKRERRERKEMGGGDGRGDRLIRLPRTSAIGITRY